MCTGEKVSAFNYRGAIKVHTNEHFSNVIAAQVKRILRLLMSASCAY